MQFQRTILKRLYRRRIIGGKHTAIEHLTAGISGHLIGEAKRTIAELVKKGYLLPKPTSYGLQISINPEKMPEILEIIEGGYSQK